ncbi:reverse transcriptase domain-containing protein [Tanacetum coccineum]
MSSLMVIMPLRMMTQSVGRETATPRDGRKGGRTGLVIRVMVEMMVKKLKYTASSFVGKALTWWNSQIHTRGRESAVGMSWEVFKTLTREEFCQSNKMQKLETKLWNHAIVGASHVACNDRFHELARLVPHLVTLEGKRIERYVYGLALQIRGMVATMEPKTIQKAM